MLKGWAFVVVTALIVYALLLREIHKVRRAEAKQREGEERYREIFNASSDAIFYHQVDDGKILDMGTVDELVERHGGPATVEAELDTVPADRSILPAEPDGNLLAGPGPAPDRSGRWIQYGQFRVGIGGRKIELGAGSRATARNGCHGGHVRFLSRAQRRYGKIFAT